MVLLREDEKLVSMDSSLITLWGKLSFRLWWSYKLL